MKKKTTYILIVLAAIVVVMTAIGIVALKGQKLNLKETTRVEVPFGTDYAALVDSLDAHHCIPNHPLFHTMAKMRGLPKHIKSGSYLFEPGATMLSVIQHIYSGSQTPIRLTIPKKRTPELLCEYLGSKLAFSGDSLLVLMNNAEVCKEYGETTASIIGIFPQNTYEVYWTVTPKDLLDRMKKESDRFWSSRQAKLDDLGLTRQQVLTIASIVDEETNCNDEKPDIASVYLNRYRIGMPLQADPTVKYAVGDFSIKRIKGDMLNIENPYNTYKYQGLPPGPICIPSTSSIDAVLKNKKTNYIFFCAKEDFSGRHNFSSTISEHQNNAKKFHKALNSKNIH